MKPHVLHDRLFPDSLVTLDGLQIIQADRRSEECGKRKGGGIAVFVNERWCNPGHISLKEQCCTRDIELLAVCIQPSSEGVFTCNHYNCSHPSHG